MADEERDEHDRRTARRGPHVPTAGRLQAGRAHRRRRALRRGERRRRRLLGPPSGRPPHVGPDWDTILDWQLPFAKWFVGGKLNVSANCLDRHVEAGSRRPCRHPLGGRARRHSHDHLRRTARRGAAVRQRPEGSRRRQGRPGQHLPADDPRGGDRDARLRSHRRPAQRGVRRLLVAVAGRPHQRRRGEGAASPPTAAIGAARCSRSSRRPTRRSPTPPPSSTSSSSARRQRRRDDRRPRPLVPRPDGRRRRRVPGRADGLGGPPLPPLHVGYHRQAEGHHAHLRRLPHPGRLHPQVRVRPPSRQRRLLVHRRRRLGDRPQLHRLRSARQRRHAGDVRRRAQLPRQRSLLGDRRQVQGHEVLHGADGDPHVHEVGSGGAGQARPVEPEAARHGRRTDQPRGVDVVPRAHRSVAAARSSTRGGRPRPAGS